MTFIEKEMGRLCDILQKSDPTQDEYYRVLAAIRGLAEHSKAIEAFIPDSFNEPVTVNETVKPTEPTVDPDYAIPDETPFSLEEKVLDEQPVDTSSDSVEYEMADVRAALIEAKKNGFNSAELIRSYGVDNITAIPASKYGEIMAKLKEIK